MIIIRFLVLVWACVLMSACSSVEKIDGLNMSLVRLQKLADSNLPVGRRKISRNGREFYSLPFVTKRGEFVNAKEGSVRNTAIIKVLGDRRPYIMEIQVVKEVRGSNGYSKSGYDEGLARVIRRRIQKALVQRREDLNIIDDFKAF